MRALKVLGIAENGTQVVCQPAPDEEDGTGKSVTAVETFTLAVDERLRAAVRGDLSRIGQLEIEMESQLRPREIQQRIRAGSTVEQVAAAAGCSPDRIERYAYPVLLERSTIADRARRAHPVVDGEIAARSVEALAGETLAARGQQATINWDAFRDERGWALRATWKAGRSENRATWSFHAGPAGGTVIARDETAAVLADPAPRPLRTVGAESGGPVVAGHLATRVPNRAPNHLTPHSPSRAVDQPMRRSSTLADTASADPTDVDEPTFIGESDAAESADEPTIDSRDDAATVDAEPARTDIHEASASSPSAALDGRDEFTDAADDGLDAQRRLVADTVTDARSGSRPMPRGDAIRAAADGVLRAGEIVRVRDTGTDGPTPPQPATVAGASSSSGAPRAKRSQRAPMPSWEDILLGTRTGR